MNKHIANLNKLNNNKEMIQYCEKHLTLLGKGSSRIVFQLSKTQVIKIALSKAGIIQNETEVMVYSETVHHLGKNYSRYLASIYINKCHKTDIFIVQQYVEKNRSIVSSRKFYPHFKRMKQTISHIDECMDTHNYNDIRYANVGRVKGQLKMLDYGFNKEIYKIIKRYGHTKYQKLFPKEIIKA